VKKLIKHIFNPFERRSILANDPPFPSIRTQPKQGHLGEHCAQLDRLSPRVSHPPQLPLQEPPHKHHIHIHRRLAKHIVGRPDPGTILGSTRLVPSSMKGTRLLRLCEEKKKKLIMCTHILCEQLVCPHAMPPQANK
jgi:hypothetical protein